MPFSPEMTKAQIFFEPHKEGYSVPQKERPRITPDDFEQDGNSRQAREFADSWLEAQREGDLTAIIGCSDARTIYNPKNAVGIRTIAAAVPEELYKNVLSKDFGTKNVVVMAHHDGRRVQEGSRPPGCGGRDEKAKMRDAMENPNSEGALRYVHEHVTHEDPIIGAYSSALDIAERANLPVMAVTLDHITGKLTPLASFQQTSRGGIEYHSPVSIRKILDGHYDPKEVYSQGIPAMGSESIPDDFQIFLRRHERYIDDIKLRNPEFESEQAIQNPDTVLITTVVRPSRGRLPKLSGESSNRIFAITVARKSGDENTDVDEQSIISAADEVEYPLANGILSGGDPNRPFSSLNHNGTVIIETRNIARSRNVAYVLMQKPWFKNWAKNSGNKIMVAQTTRGIVDTAEYFSTETPSPNL